MRRSLSLPIVALFSTVPVVAQTTGAGAPPPASKPQDATASTETRKTRRVLTNEDLSKSTGKISVVGNGQDDKPKAAAPRKAANANPAYVASVRNQLEKLLKQMVDLDKQITDLKNFKAGEPSTNASGVRLDKRYEREPIEVQIRALQDKKKDLQSKLDALYDEARKKGVPSGELP
jgi:chaperonin cofactor prefoldin